MNLNNEPLMLKVVERIKFELQALNSESPDEFNIKMVSFIPMHPDIKSCEDCQYLTVSCQRCVLALWEKPDEIDIA